MDLKKIVMTVVFVAALLTSSVFVASCSDLDSSEHGGGNSFLVGCSRNAIVGKFQETGGTEILEFFNDGTCTVTNSVTSLGGTYSYEDSFGGYSIKIEGPFGIVGSYEGYLDNNTLTVVNGSKEDVYERQ